MLTARQSSACLLFAVFACSSAFGEGKDSKAEAAQPDSPALAECPAPTGSRIRPSKGSDCPNPAPGVTVYSQEDLERTGEAEVGAALRRLDPRL